MSQDAGPGFNAQDVAQTLTRTDGMSGEEKERKRMKDRDGEQTGSQM